MTAASFENTHHPEIRRWSPHLLLLLLPFIPLLVLSLYVKFAVAKWHGYFLLASRQSLAHPDQLSFWSKAGIYLPELLVGCAALPLLAAAARLLLPGRSALWFCSLLSAVLVFLLYLQLQCYYLVGRFLSLPFLRAAASFTSVDPSIAGQYISRMSLLKLMLVLVAVQLLARAAFFVYGAASGLRQPFILQPVKAAGFLTAALLLCLAAEQSAPTPYHRSILCRAAADFAGIDELDTAIYTELSEQELVSEYRRLAKPPKPSRSGPYFGIAPGRDVILIVLETAPMRIFGDRGLRRFPEFDRLAEQAFVGRRHHSTYPISNRALFSLLTSWYPSNTSVNFNRQYPAMKPPSLPGILQAQGWRSALAAPVEQRFQDDDRMFRALGIEELLVPDQAAAGRESGLPAESGLAEDRSALAGLSAWIADRIDAGERYFAVFTPALGHAPWMDISPEQNIDDWQERGRRIAAEQAGWIGKLASALAERGRLESTILVVTSDHGLRTIREAPDLPLGTASADTFHVPLLIAAPGALQKTIEIDWVTSHIDVAPTVLQLLGFDPAPLRPQGSPIWQPVLKERRTFFFGRYFLSADALHERGTWVMRSDTSGSLYLSSTAMQFPRSSLLLEEDSRYLPYLRLFKGINSLQQVWALRFRDAGRQPPPAVSGGSP